MDPTGKKKVLIAGGGVAALEAALALRELAPERVTVKLLAPEQHFTYRPMSVAEPFRLGEVARFDLEALAPEIGATLTRGALVAIDEWRHVAYTSTNTDVEYDLLLVACGAVPFPAIPGALTFRGPVDVPLIEGMLHQIASGDVRSVAFVIPWGAVWSLPAYELALLTAAHLRAHDLTGVRLSLVTPEAEPLQLFGEPASAAARALLDEHGIELRAGAYAAAFERSRLELVSDGFVAADRVVALPRLEGARLDGLPQTVHGFLSVDAHGRVHGVTDVFAAGDITSFTVKQGGTAAAGADVTPRRFRPVLRGLLLTGREPRYLRRELALEPEETPVAASEPLWWPPAKIVGRRLAPFLSSLTGAVAPSESDVAPCGAVAVEVELDEEALRAAGASRPALDEPDEMDPRVGELMSKDPVVIAPEDTLGEIAERLLQQGVTAVAVAEYGRVLGILTSGDLLRAAAARAHPSEARARQWMTAEPLTVTATSSIPAAARLMTEYGIDHLLVVEGERPVGMLRLDDALREESIPLGLGF